MQWVFVEAKSRFLLGLGFLLLSGCGGSNNDTQAPHINQPPVAANDVLRADGAQLSSINVVANDHDPDGDSLIVAIVTPPDVGTASINTDNTVQLSGLPGDFKGITRFSYRITDPSGASATANAAIFVGTAPFRVAFAGDASGGGTPDVYLTDFTAGPQLMTSATQDALRLQGFAASADGSTIVYRRADPANAQSGQLLVVRTSAPGQQTVLTFPAGVIPAQDANGKDEFVVSPDGQWIAAVAGSGTADALYLFNATSPATAGVLVSPGGTVHASQPKFSDNSAALYFLATSNSGGGSRILYTVAPASLAPAVQVSASINAGSDDLPAYTVPSDQSRILLEANRGGAVGIYWINPLNLQMEMQINQPLGLGESIIATTVGFPPEQGGSARAERVAYATQTLLTFNVYVADVSATPTPHLVASSGARVVGFRPDDSALLYSRSGVVYESPLDGSGDQMVGAGAYGWYDSTGNIVLLEQFLPSGGSPPSYTALAETTRGAFGTTQQLGTPVLAAVYFDVSGFSHGVALLGEGATTGTPPTAAHLALVNALAPDKLLYLASFNSPIDLRTPATQVVE